MATKRKPKAQEQLAIRAAPELLERADDLIEFLSELRGVRVTRSDVAREAMVRGFKSLEEERARRKP